MTNPKPSDMTLEKIFTELDQGKFLDKDGIEGAIAAIQQLIERGLPEKKANTLQDFQDTLDDLSERHAEMLIDWRCGYNTALDDLRQRFIRSGLLPEREKKQ